MAFKQGRLQTAIMWSMFFIPLSTCASVCGEKNISQVSVASCNCASNFPDSHCSPCTTNCGTPNDKLRVCSKGCTDENMSCSACDIYFDNLCGCLQDKKCYHTPNTDPWTLLHDGFLITTPHLIQGILEVGTDNRGWQLGQDTLLNNVNPPAFSRASGTLAMNSVLARTKEQVHIHVCNRQTSALRAKLDNLSPSAYTTLKPMPFSITGFPQGKIHCQASKKKGDNQFPMADLVHGYLATLTSCDPDHLGAGLITDRYDNTWGCVTEGGSAEDLFCRM